MSMQTHTLDARNLSCPLPILRTRKALNAMQAGELLEITTTDKGSLEDLRSFCKETGNKLISSESESDTYSFTIRKG